LYQASYAVTNEIEPSLNTCTITRLFHIM